MGAAGKADTAIRTGDHHSELPLARVVAGKRRPRVQSRDRHLTQKLTRNDNWNCLGSNAEVYEKGSVTGPRRASSE